MNAVEVIDLTLSSPSRSPSIICIEDDTPVIVHTTGKTENSGRKRRRKRKNDEQGQDFGSRRGHEEKQNSNDLWKHDKFFEDVADENTRRRADDVESLRKSEVGERSPTPAPLFMIDTAGDRTISAPSPPLSSDDVAGSPTHLNSCPTTSMVGPHHVEDGLLLPGHVKCLTKCSEELLSENTPLSPVSEASGIDFIDDDRAVGAPRYFHDTAVNVRSTRSRGPCANCGDDDHDRKTCPNMICITCGARNEHGSRSCPILRFCWNCKAKGHIAKDCPRIGNMDKNGSDRQDCERCGSWRHYGTNCPTLWRIYSYLTDAEREAILAARESRRQLSFDNGGEGYIARDRWCYNCGGSGHLGDDCEVATSNYDRPQDYSAFSSFNELTGPFTSSSSVVPIVERGPREWEPGGQGVDGDASFPVEGDVGKKGRENAKAKAREAQRLLEENDEPDWFTSTRPISTNERVKATLLSNIKLGLPPKPPPPVIHFNFQKPKTSGEPINIGNDSRQPPRLSLRDRIDLGDAQDSNPAYGEGRNKRGNDIPTAPRSDTNFQMPKASGDPINIESDSWRPPRLSWRDRKDLGDAQDSNPGYGNGRNKRGKDIPTAPRSDTRNRPHGNARKNQPWREGPRRERGSQWHGGYSR